MYKWKFGHEITDADLNKLKSTLEKLIMKTVCINASYVKVVAEELKDPRYVIIFDSNTVSSYIIQLIYSLNFMLWGVVKTILIYMNQRNRNLTPRS